MLLAHRSWGEGADKVALLLHRGRDASTTWNKVGPWFARQGWHAIAVDLRGHGASNVDPDSRDYSLSTTAADLVETVAAIRPDKKRVDVLVGHAFGALVAMMCVAEHPSFARRLVLEEPPGPSFNPVKTADDTARWITMGKTGDVARMPDSVGLAPEELADKAAASAAVDPDYLPQVMRGFAELSFPAMAARCHVPTLLVLGRDKGEPFSEGWPTIAEYSLLAGADRAKFLAPFPRGELVSIETGHYVHTRALDEFVAAVGKWLEKEPA
jgi:pimeloyl-ACP methyl ester carboxylesterase